MSNYNAVFRTSYFCVTDEERYKELARGFPRGVSHFGKEEDGKTFHAFGDFSSFEYHVPASVSYDVPVLFEEGVAVFNSDGKQVSIEEVDNYDVLFDSALPDRNVIWDRNQEEDYGEGFDWFVAELQKILADDSAFVLIESGYEKLRYIDAFVWVVTKKQVRCSSLDDYIAKSLGEMLSDDAPLVQWQY